MYAKDVLMQIQETNEKGRAILASLVTLTEDGFDPCKVDVTNLAKIALDYCLQNEELINQLEKEQ